MRRTGARTRARPPSRAGHEASAEQSAGGKGAAPTTSSASTRERRQREGVENERERERGDAGLQGQSEPRRDQVEVARRRPGPGRDRSTDMLRTAVTSTSGQSGTLRPRRTRVAERRRTRPTAETPMYGQEPRQRDGSNSGPSARGSAPCTANKYARMAPETRRPSPRRRSARGTRRPAAAAPEGAGRAAGGESVAGRLIQAGAGLEPRGRGRPRRWRSRERPA